MLKKFRAKNKNMQENLKKVLTIKKNRDKISCVEDISSLQQAEFSVLTDALYHVR